jgi:hypothetical protein
MGGFDVPYTRGDVSRKDVGRADGKEMRSKSTDEPLDENCGASEEGSWGVKLTLAKHR